jgi:subtilisin-like proprotein convertase family protein
LDDAFELNHEDFAGNSSAALSWNFQTGNNNVAPTLASDNHGTAVAGVTAARGGNGIGVTGAAPLATFGGFRVLFSGATVANYVDAMKLFSHGSDTTVKLKNHSYGPTSNYQVQTSINAAIADSANAGTIHVFSAGNSRGTITEDTNRFPNHSSRDVITVAALGSDGIFSDYSNFGACIFVTAPTSSNRPNAFGIVTTDRSGAPGYNGSEPLTNRNYTMFFGGTSSSAPLVTGCLTLAKQAQPALNVRFAKHLLARFSTIVDPGDATVTSDGGWRTNSAGFTFNQNYGFGNINADLVSAQALNFTGVTPRTNEVTQVINVDQQIPDNNPAGLTRNFTMAQTGPLEEVEVFVAITHPYRGDIEIFLTNPDGYTSRLVRRTADSGDNISWIFLTNAFWGTNPAGQWTLRVVDTAAGDVGTWNSYQVRTNMGTLIPASKAGITWQNTSTGNVVNWYINSGAVTGSQLIGVPPSTQWQVRAAGDMNGDGVADIIWQNTATGQVAVWYLDGSGAVTGSAVIAVVADPAWVIVDAAEMSGDAHTDLLWINTSSGLIVQWLMNGSGGVNSTRVVTAAPGGWSLKASKNVVGSSVADLLWQSTDAAGNLVIWEMNASGGVSNSIFVGATGSAAWQAQKLVQVFPSQQGIVFRNTSTNQLAYWALNASGAVVSTGVFGTAPAGWEIRASGSF